MKQAVLSRVETILQEVLDVPRLAVRPDTPMNELRGWDSLTQVSFTVEAEQAFGIHLRSGELGRLSDVGELVRLIEERSSVAAR